MRVNDIKMIQDVHSRGETRAGRTRPAPRRRVWSEVARRTRVAIGPPVTAADEQTARQLAARWPSTHTTRMEPLFPQILSGRFGMATAVNAVIEAARDDRTLELPKRRKASRTMSRCSGPTSRRKKRSA